MDKKKQESNARSYFRELTNNFWVKILKLFDADADPDPVIFLTLDPGSGINITDPQHCFL
jgi:hypothetical protein